MIDLVEDPPAPVAKKRRKRRKKPVASLTRWEAQIGKKKFYSDQQPGLQEGYLVLTVEGRQQFVSLKGKPFTLTPPVQSYEPPPTRYLPSPERSSGRFDPAGLLGTSRHVESQEEREEYVESFADRQKRELEAIMGPKL